MKKFRKHPPAGWREGFEGELACPHRDLSVCGACAAGEHAHQLGEVFGVHYWLESSLAARDYAAMVKVVTS